MQAVNYFCAKILHSSQAAFSLAMKNNKYTAFAEKMISAKNEKAFEHFIKTYSSLIKRGLTDMKISKYESLLKSISKITHHENPYFLKNNSNIPRGGLIENKNPCYERILKSKLKIPHPENPYFLKKTHHLPKMPLIKDYEYFNSPYNQPRNITFTSDKESLKRSIGG